MTAVAQELKDCVETVIVMPNENSDNFKTRCKEKGIPYVSLDLSRITRETSVAISYVLFFGAEIYRLSRTLNNKDMQIIHVSGGSWQIKPVIAGRLAGKRVLWHLNDTSMPRIIRMLFKLLSPLAHGYIFASQRSKKYCGGLID